MKNEEFFVRKTFTRKWICEKKFLNEPMRKILDGLNSKTYYGGSLFSIKAILKQAKKTELLLVECNDALFIIKRFKLDSLAYQIRRLFFPSRAARNWKNAQLLLQWGISTPHPIAYMERRFSLLRRESFYLMQYIEGCCLCKVLPQANQNMQSLLSEQIVSFLSTLHQKGFVHGDMKCTNMLIVKEKVFFLDLDAMRFIWVNRDRKIRKDYHRFLKNWVKEPELSSLFEKAFFEKKTALLHK